MDKNQRLNTLNSSFLAERARVDATDYFICFCGEYLCTSVYRNIQSKELDLFREFANDKNAVNKKTRALSIFTFKTFVNADILHKEVAR